MSDPVDKSDAGDWPFDQPPNCAAISIRSIADGNAPILLVSHDLDDHGWQFLSGEDFGVEDGVVLSLENVLSLDPSIREVADIPPGWHAWRGSVNEPWRREQSPVVDEA